MGKFKELFSHHTWARRHVMLKNIYRSNLYTTILLTSQNWGQDLQGWSYWQWFLFFVICLHLVFAYHNFIRENTKISIHLSFDSCDHHKIVCAYFSHFDQKEAKLEINCISTENETRKSLLIQISTFYRRYLSTISSQ